MPDLSPVVAHIRNRRSATPAEHAVLVGLSGIDGSGKGFVAAALSRGLESHDLRTAVLNVDGWLNLPAVRFSREHPAEHFYRNALRLDEMFQDLVLPLRQRRTRHLIAQYADETAMAYREHRYDLVDVDIVVLEGIFIYKQAYRRYFDLALWLDCSFETALERALQRGQEGLAASETIAAYETIYFPAQRLHFWRDEPRRLADATIANDPRLVGSDSLARAE